MGLLLIVVLLGCYGAGIIAGESFTYYDNSHFTNGSLMDRPISLQISPEQGRFWPLGHQEFNLVGRVTHSVTGYHLFRIAELLAVSVMLFFLLRDLQVRARIGILLLLLITPSILICFSGLIYPEANEIFWLCSMAWCVKRFELTHLRAWAIAAVISTQFLLYYKETAFVLVVGFAASRLLMRCREKSDGTWDFRHLHDSESRLDACLCVLTLVFLLYFCAVLYPDFGLRYEANSRMPLGSVLGDYLRLDLLAWLCVAVWVVRMYRIVTGRARPAMIFDGLAAAGAACFIGYALLAMFSSYYLAPVDLIGGIYLGRIVATEVTRWSLSARFAVVVLATVVCVQDVSLSAVRTYERKNIVYAKAEIGEVVDQRFHQNPQAVKRLYFPFATPFSILEFASYLNYLGVPVEQGTANAVQKPGVILSGDQVRRDGPCGYRVFLCHPASAPLPGDLVIILPDDASSQTAIKAYRDDSKATLFAYQPYPLLQGGLRALVNRLHFVSPAFETKPFPDSWLTGSVSVW